MRIPKTQSLLILAGSLFVFAIWWGIKKEMNPYREDEANLVHEHLGPSIVTKDSQRTKRSGRKLSASERNKTTVRYEIDSDFLGILFENWREQNPDMLQNGMWPRGSPAGMVDAIGITISKDEIFRHNRLLDRSFIHATMSIADHAALESAHRKFVGEDIVTVSDTSYLELFEENSGNQEEPESSVGDDPFTPILE